MGRITCCLTVDTEITGTWIEQTTRTVDRQRAVMEVEGPHFTVVERTGGQTAAIKVKCSRTPRLVVFVTVTKPLS